MKQFLVLYGMPAAAMEEMMKNSSPEEMKKGMDEWLKWQEDHKANIPVLGAPVGKNKRINKDGVVDMRNEIGGYSVFAAESYEDVAKILADSPHFQMPGTYVDVMELVEMK